MTMMQMKRMMLMIKPVFMMAILNSSGLVWVALLR